MPRTVQRGSVVATAGVELVVEICPDCQCVHAVPRDLYDRAVADSKVDIYCPNGHRWGFTKTLREDLEKAVAAGARAENRAALCALERDRIEHSRAALRGYLTRFKKRVAAAGEGTDE